MWKYSHILQINGDGVKNLNILLHDGNVLYLSHFNDELQLLKYEHELLIYNITFEVMATSKQKFAKVEI